MFRVAVERVHHTAPVLVYLGCHALVVIPAPVVAGLYAVARVRAHLHGGSSQEPARSLYVAACSLAVLFVGGARFHRSEAHMTKYRPGFP